MDKSVAEDKIFNFRYCEGRVIAMDDSSITIKSPVFSGRESTGELIRQFKDYYNSRNYREHPSVKVSSGIDPTVRFIGSHISVFKPYLAKRDVPSQGFYIVQHCIRTRNLKQILDASFDPKWGSYFVSMGTLLPPGSLETVCSDALSFLNGMGIPITEIRARVSEEDGDLLGMCEKYFSADRIEKDTFPRRYYQHEIGMPGVRGRNFNIALQDCKGVVADVGNVIVLQQGAEPIGVELALGVSTMQKQVYGLDHVMDCYSVHSLHCADAALERKIKDLLIISLILYVEGLRPSALHNRNRLLKKYLTSLNTLRKRANLGIDELKESLRSVDLWDVPNTDGKAIEMICDFMRDCESDRSILLEEKVGR